jgi:hypothetical protein
MAAWLKVLWVAVLYSTALAVPSQKPIPVADPGFPIPQPLPPNGTLPGVDYDFIAKLRNAPNAIARIAMLKDEDFKFDFRHPPQKRLPGSVVEGKGGKAVNALSFTMPALIDQGMAMVMAFIKPW